MTPEEQDKAFQQIRERLASRKAPVQVLIVEDDPRDADVTMERLRAIGAIATWVRDAKETQGYLRDHDPWLVFLDMKLGRVSGLQVLEFLRLLKPECQVIILTGAYEHDSAECKEALKKGAKAVALKPLSESLIQLLFSAP